MEDKDKSLRHKKRAFLAAYSEVGNITQAAIVAGVSRQSHYDWLKEDADYPQAFRTAGEEAGERLEQEARRRAVTGIDKPIFQGGKQVGVVREYSDTLLIFLMKGNMPEKYKDRVHQEHSGLNGGPININKNIDLANLTEEELEALEKLLTKTAATD